MIIQQQEASIKKMKTAINACRSNQQIVDFITQRCNAFEQVDSVIDDENGVFIITVSTFYNNDGLTEHVQFCGYVQEQTGTFCKSHVLHGHFFYHKTYRILEYAELCSNFSASSNAGFGNLMIEAFLSFMRRLNAERIKYVLPRNLAEYRKQKSFYESFGFHMDNAGNAHEMWLSL